MKTPLQKAQDALHAIYWVQAQPYHREFTEATLKTEAQSIERLKQQIEELSE